MQDPLYTLLRHFTSPVVAVTTSAGGRKNGMIANSAQRASLVPTLPRVSLYISKVNYTHELVTASGVFGLHLLRDDQWDVIRGLGVRSGREDAEKLNAFPTAAGDSGCPMLLECRASFECRVVNTMDAGAATFFLGDIVAVREPSPGAGVMTSEHFRLHLPDDLRAAYEANLEIAQRVLAPLAEKIDTGLTWKEPSARP